MAGESPHPLTCPFTLSIPYRSPPRSPPAAPPSPTELTLSRFINHRDPPP